MYQEIQWSMLFMIRQKTSQHIFEDLFEILEWI